MEIALAKGKKIATEAVTAPARDPEKLLPIIKAHCFEE